MERFATHDMIYHTPMIMELSKKSSGWNAGVLDNLHLTEINTLTFPVVFFVHVPSHRHLVTKYIQVLQVAEQQRALRFQKTDDRLRFIIGRAALRQLLGRFLNEEAAQIAIQYNPYGKPNLVHSCATNLQFNLSHAGEFITIGLDHQTVGVDIEYIDPTFNFAALLTTNFSAEEICFIQNSSSPHATFYLLWTRKEAILKQIGCGLSVAPLHIPALTGQQAFVTDDETTLQSSSLRTYSGQLYENQYVFSICLNSSIDAPPAFINLQLA